MIFLNHEGRARSVRTSKEELKEINRIIGSMTPKERKMLDAVLKNFDGGDDVVYDLLNQYRYRWKPVSVEQFIDDPYYLGQSTQTLYPGVRQAIVDLFSEPGNREAILTGSIGWGKTTFLSIAMAYLIYQMSCLRAPQIAYGLSPGSEIVIALISKSMHTALKVMKTAVDEKLKLSPYFEEHFQPIYTKENTKFPNNINMTISSAASERIIGMNVFGAAVDEANFMASRGEVIKTGGRKTVANFDQAEKIYGSLTRRIKSRFMDNGGDLPGLVCLVSSANTLNSFTDRMIREKKDDSTVFVRDFATWDVRPSENFSGDKFKILVGASSMRSKILLDDDTVDETLLTDGARIIEVPEEYRGDFERDLEGSIRDVAGISTTAVSVYVHRVDKVIDRRCDWLEHPFTEEEWTYGTEGGFAWERLARKVKVRLPGGYEETQWVPLRRPDVPRHIHFDPAISGDCFGVAMGYIDRWVEVVRRAANGEQYIDQAPHFVIEFMLKVWPPFGDQIYLADMRATFAYAIMEHGFHLSGFSCDTYQSTETIQQMKRKGVNAFIVSVDTSTNPYDALKSAVYEDRVDYYKYLPFEQEFLALEYDRRRGKIDHPVAGSKDVSDAVAGVVSALMQTSTRMPLSPVASDQKNDVESQMDLTDGRIVVTDDNYEDIMDLARSKRGSTSGPRKPLPFLGG